MDYMELQAMLETPELMGRGKPCAVIMGGHALMSTLHAIPSPVFETDVVESPIKAGMKLLGFPVYVPENHPDVAFAVTHDELERVLQNIGPLVKSGGRSDDQRSDDNPGG